jgi:hypothetical protein
MTGFAGFDRSQYPGRVVMDWLKTNTDLKWCGYYLAPAPSHGDASWMDAQSDDFDGWGFAPIYVGRQVVGPGSHLVTEANGTLDGAAACGLMSDAGFDPGTFLWLDLENGPPFTEAQKLYVGAWVDAVKAGGYGPGVYCSFLFAAEVAALRPEARIWVFHVRTVSPHAVPGEDFPTPDPTTSGYAEAKIWQRDDEARITCPVASGGVLAADLNSANSEDPSAP